MIHVVEGKKTAPTNKGVEEPQLTEEENA